MEDLPQTVVMCTRVDVGVDCTVGDVNTDIADFRSDNTVQRPVEAYWVDVTEQIESIR